MTADLDTLSMRDYSLGDEVLPDLTRSCSDAPAVAVARFERSRELFERHLGWAEGAEAAGLQHSELEARLQLDARELFCQLYQDHLDLRAARERVIEDAVTGSDGNRRGCVERGRRRQLATVFGEVQVSRIAYRSKVAQQSVPR